MDDHIMAPYGELEYCKICMGFEGSMPTDCPGKKMSEKETERVYAGNLDFRKEEGWVNKLSPIGKSIVVRRIYDMLSHKTGSCKSDAEIILSVGTTRDEYYKVKKECLKYLYN